MIMAASPLGGYQAGFDECVFLHRLSAGLPGSTSRGHFGWC